MYNWNIELFHNDELFFQIRLCTYILYKIYLWKYPPPPLECFWNGKLFGPPASHSSTTSQCPRPRNIKMFILVFRQSSAVYPIFFFHFFWIFLLTVSIFFIHYSSIKRCQRRRHGLMHCQIRVKGFRIVIRFLSCIKYHRNCLKNQSLGGFRRL